MGKPAGHYVQILVFRMLVTVLAVLVAAWAGHDVGDARAVWLLASILAVGASACLIWPFVVPGPAGAMSTYTIGPAFFLAGLFLLPPGALALAIVGAVVLAGLVRTSRPYRTLFQASSSLIVFGGFAVAFDLAPRPSDFLIQPAVRAGMELIIGAAALTSLLIVRSVHLRIEHGADAPPLGAFQGPAVAEALLCIVFSTSITVLARIHPALLAVVAIEVGAIWWFLSRYAWYASGARETAIEEARALLAPRRMGVRRGAGRMPGREDEDEDEDDDDWRSVRARRAL